MRSPIALAPLALLIPGAAQAGVVINEIFPNPAGTDSGSEWLELYNDGAADEDVSGWTIEAGTSAYKVVYTVPSGTILAPGDWLLIGDPAVSGADLSLPSGTLGLGNASNADAVRILDSAGAAVDTLVYGTTNTDGWADDTGAAAVSLAPAPTEGKAIARAVDGVDTDLSGVDFLRATATPDASNVTGGGDTDTGDGGGDTDTGLPTECGGPGSGVTINEALVDPVGADAGLEWVELYNAGDQDVDLTGWAVQSATSSWSTEATVDGLVIAPGEWVVIGGTSVAGADWTDAGFSLPNGTNGDGARLVDCAGAVVDTLVYGGSNADGIVDDSGAVATSIAPDPSEGTALQRREDGLDTDQSGEDFVLQAAPTPGAANPPIVVEPCAPSTGVVTINELLPDPAGTDTGFEWFELHNAGGEAVSLSGWYVSTATKPDDFGEQSVLFGSAAIAAGGYLVVGGASAATADVVASFTLGNGTGGDALRLYDCEGTAVDTVVYGADNADLMPDDSGVVAVSLAPKPGSGKALARIADGVDTDASGVDFEVAGYNTPGVGNDTLPEDCGAALGGLKINELLVNSVGSDGDGLEWVELYNAGSAPIDLTGWAIEKASSTWSSVATFEAGAIAPGEWLLVGGAAVSDADWNVDGFALPDGTGGDGVRVVDCAGFVADTVVYGSTNDDAIVDDTGAPATSLASKPTEGVALQRRDDGVDTDQAAADFALQEAPTPGADNPTIESDPCVPSAGTVTINELMPDPDGTDTDLEWFELYNSGGSAVSLSGWYLSTATKPDDLGEQSVLFGAGTAISAEDYFVVGGAGLDFPDLVKTLSLGNGTAGDALRLYDCEGTAVDTVVYGPDNADLMPDDAGAIPEPYGDPGSNQVLARVDDGADDDAAEDWFVDVTPTPGATNFQEPVIDTGDDGPGGRGCGKRPDGGDPAERGCATIPAAPGFAPLLLLALAWRRRRA